MRRIDLHTHSTASDGTFTPTELIDYAVQKGLAAIALTDHDTTAGLAEAEARAREAGITFVRGVEFSTVHPLHDVHIVGLDIDPTHPLFAGKIQEFQHNREQRNLEILERMRDIGHFPISMDILHEIYGDGVMTRANFARWLFEKGYTASVREAFALWLGEDCPCYVPRKKVDPAEAIQIITASGGIPILAHPLMYHLDPEPLEQLVLSLKEEGLAGMEVYYSNNVGDDEARMEQLARRHGLRISGGSDFHGKNKPLIDLGTGKNNLNIPYRVLEELRRR